MIMTLIFLTTIKNKKHMKTFLSFSVSPCRTINIEVKQESALRLLHTFTETDCPFPVSVIMEEGEPGSKIDNFVQAALVLLTVI